MAADAGKRRVRGGRLTPQRRQMLDRLLDQALEQPMEQRAELVRRCVARAPRLGFWLQRLVMASAEPTGFIDQSARHMAADALAARTDLFPRTLVRGTRLGPWRIIARIGTGGMGEVYQAERADGTFEMTVAIKLIRSRKENLARLLESERQLLARLNHGSIARLIDGGLAEDGRPYLVMEWVDGRTLGEWAQGNDIPAERFLDVFGDVCEALAFAHRALVVHGDIKPANLAVTRDGQVKLLDFGVAQLLDVEQAELSPSALTPGFAAPEQIGQGEVSTASDIFSLGALLYWMLYGKAPHREQPRPDLRATWHGYRRLPDLLAIVDKAMAPDPEQRYATVNALLLELGRLREDKPINARSLSLLERAGLWVRRRRLAAALGGLAAVAVVGGMSTVVWQARIVAQERDVARHEAAVSLAGKDHFILLFREVTSLNPNADELTARDLLDQTAEAARIWLKDDPQSQLEIQLAVAEILMSLDDYARAEPLLETILEGVDQSHSAPLRARLYRNMAMVLHRRGDVARGLLMADQSVRMIERFSGDHRERLSDALQMRARLRREHGDWEGAVQDLRRARLLALATAEGARPVQARAEGNLAATYLLSGNFVQAIDHMLAADALWSELERSESPDALTNRHNLAAVLDRLGRIEEAEQRFRTNVSIRSQRFGPSGSLGAAKVQLGRILAVRGEFEEARELIQQAQEMMRLYVGAATPDYASTYFALGELARARSDFDAAAKHFARAEAIFGDALGEGHPFTLFARAELAAAMAYARDQDPESDFAGIAEAFQAIGPAANSYLAQLYCERSRWRLAQGWNEQAHRDAERCEDLRKALSQGGWRLLEAEALSLLAASRLGNGAEPRVRLHQVLDRLAEQMSPEHHRLQSLQTAAGSGG
ncbi:MAG: serine/threonine-protein kinase [Wenzhouxiangella sp.]|nr:serine/threonine-protein kinase [Wenzhouxiangella sp.]